MFQLDYVPDCAQLEMVHDDDVRGLFVGKVEVEVEVACSFGVWYMMVHG